MGVEKVGKNKFVNKEPVVMKRGGFIVGVTESHAVAKKFTDGLENALINHEQSCHIVEIPQFSQLEVEHILANFEITGIGRLRFDRGQTVMDDQEVAFLRMVSGGIGQRLLDSCCDLE